jgi:thioredoxin reductase (NADPH)
MVSRNNRPQRSAKTDVLLPNSGWLKGCVVLDNKGFIRTGPDLSSEELTGACWPLTRRPYVLETSGPEFSLPVMFAEAMSNASPRLGEGSIANSLVHQRLESNPPFLGSATNFL